MILIFSYGLPTILILVNCVGGGLSKPGGSLKVILLLSSSSWWVLSPSLQYDDWSPDDHHCNALWWQMVEMYGQATILVVTMMDTDDHDDDADYDKGGGWENVEGPEGFSLWRFCHSGDQSCTTSQFDQSKYGTLLFGKQREFYIKGRGGWSKDVRRIHHIWQYQTQPHWSNTLPVHTSKAIVGDSNGQGRPSDGISTRIPPSSSSS